MTEERKVGLVVYAGIAIIFCLLASVIGFWPAIVFAVVLSILGALFG